MDREVAMSHVSYHSPIAFPPRSLRPEVGLPVSPRSEPGLGALSIELGQASFDRLTQLEDCVREISARLVEMQEQQAIMVAAINELREFVVGQRTIKDWYSPEEVAEILGKRPYTVREWCRYARINARKRPTGRGDAREWEISHEELERIKSHGLLPIPSKY